MLPSPRILALAVLPLLAASQARADVTYHDTLVHETTTTVEIDIDDSTVLCSAADYGAFFLKVLIPELAGITLLDHENFGAGAPCVAAGTCGPGNEPQDIIDDSVPTEVVDIEVEAVRRDWIDAEAGTCNPWLIENVEVEIRGVTFTHQRQADLGSRPLEDCNTAAVPEVPEDPEEPDEDGGDEDADGGDDGSESDAMGAKPDAYRAEPPQAGENTSGCSTASGGSAPAFLLVLLGLAGWLSRSKTTRMCR